MKIVTGVKRSGERFHEGCRPRFEGTSHFCRDCSAFSPAEPPHVVAVSGELPDATPTPDGPRIAPLGNDVPDAAEALKAKAFALLPHVKVTDLLLEVDRRTDFTGHFAHPKAERPAADRSLLLATVLADALIAVRA